MTTDQLLILLPLFFLLAGLYTSVGHAGASGYLAAMALVAVAPEAMRPTALALNILVATFTTWRFHQAGYTSWRALWPFLAGSVPLAALGGSLRLGTSLYYVLIGLVLLLSAIVLGWRAVSRPPQETLTDRVQIPLAPAVAIGAVIGLLSGLTGTGGGIFLSPIVLLAGWVGPRHSGGISAPFILVNSATALLAGTATWAALPAELPWLAGAVLVGAAAGTWLGLRRLSTRGLLLLLAVVLTIAAAKLFLSAG
ncbi:MAG: sulfite exporter TauE/SafE family protein [Gammaproteobacteria bacterium]|nr:sulfite exporter TauE/SafE family protein [Gammaproteobacteria bacterium]